MSSALSWAYWSVAVQALAAARVGNAGLLKSPLVVSPPFPVARLMILSLVRRFTPGRGTSKAGRNDLSIAPGRPLEPRKICAPAEGKRFELLVRGYRTLVFKTSSIGRSDNLP